MIEIVQQTLVVSSREVVVGEVQHLLCSVQHRVCAVDVLQQSAHLLQLHSVSQSSVVAFYVQVVRVEVVLLSDGDDGGG